MKSSVRFFSATAAILFAASFALFAGQSTSGDSSRTGSNHGLNTKAVHQDGGMKKSTGRTKPDTAQPASTKLPETQLLFFMNPNGRPCQMQLSIINGMQEKLKTLASVKFIKTTEPKDEELFYTYGIRGLPSLIIADKNGKEIKRFSPGIQDEKTILDALGGSSQ
jgi:thioredoxin 1